MFNFDFNLALVFIIKSPVKWHSGPRVFSFDINLELVFAKVLLIIPKGFNFSFTFKITTTTATVVIDSAQDFKPFISYLLE